MKNPKIVITDNRMTYEAIKFSMGMDFLRQRIVAKEDYQIDLMMGKIKIA